MTDAPKKRTKAEITADYRAAQEAAGLCRECREPVKVKNGRKLKVCIKHAAADAARKRPT